MSNQTAGSNQGHRSVSVAVSDGADLPSRPRDRIAAGIPDACQETGLLDLLVQMTLGLRLRGVDLESSTGLSGHELNLVALLSAWGPTSVKVLVAELAVPRSTMTAIVDRLQAREFVNRQPNPLDRRSVILEATPSAQDALLRYRDGMQSFVDHLEAVLAPDEQEHLVRLTRKIAESL